MLAGEMWFGFGSQPQASCSCFCLSRFRLGALYHGLKVDLSTYATVVVQPNFEVVVERIASNTSCSLRLVNRSPTRPTAMDAVLEAISIRKVANFYTLTKLTEKLR
jgi:hypothetical protein